MIGTALGIYASVLVAVGVVVVTLVAVFGETEEETKARKQKEYDYGCLSHNEDMMETLRRDLRIGSEDRVNQRRHMSDLDHETATEVLTQFKNLDHNGRSQLRDELSRLNAKKPPPRQSRFEHDFEWRD